LKRLMPSGLRERKLNSQLFGGFMKNDFGIAEIC